MADLPEVVTEIGMAFDKKDVVVVALAKIEAEIRKNIRESKADMDSIDEEQNKLEKEFRKNGKDSPPKSLVTKQKVFEKAISDAKCADVRTKIVHTVSVSADSYNGYSLQIFEQSDDHDRTGGTILAESRIKLSKRQNDILDEKESLRKRRQQRAQDNIDWRKKLQDIPAAERQMMAVVVEHEMSKSKTGKALIKTLTDNYLNTIKQIEM